MSKINNIRHSLSHIMAMAIKNLYPNVSLGIGPTIENGFYYDFSFKENITEKDLPKIETEMKKKVFRRPKGYLKTNRIN